MIQGFRKIYLTIVIVYLGKIILRPSRRVPTRRFQTLTVPTYRKMISEFADGDAAVPVEEAAGGHEPFGVGLDECAHVQVLPPLLRQPQGPGAGARKAGELRRLHHTPLL